MPKIKVHSNHRQIWRNGESHEIDSSLRRRSDLNPRFLWNRQRFRGPASSGINNYPGPCFPNGTECISGQLQSAVPPAYFSSGNGAGNSSILVRLLHSAAVSALRLAALGKIITFETRHKGVLLGLLSLRTSLARGTAL